jgi:hypothetical protein
LLHNTLASLNRIHKPTSLSHQESQIRFTNEALFEAQADILIPSEADISVVPGVTTRALSPCHYRCTATSQTDSLHHYAFHRQFSLLCSSIQHLCPPKCPVMQTFLNHCTFSSSHIESLISRDWRSNGPVNKHAPRTSISVVPSISTSRFPGRRSSRRISHGARCHTSQANILAVTHFGILQPCFYIENWQHISEVFRTPYEAICLRRLRL